MDYVTALTQYLAQDQELRKTLVYRPNSSLYRAARRLRYVRTILKGRHRNYRLVAAELTSYLESTLMRAEQGASLQSLADALAAEIPDIDRQEAEAFISELVEAQILVPNLDPALTGSEPLSDLVEVLRKAPSLASAAHTITMASSELAAMDASGPGRGIPLYLNLAKLLEPLGIPVELERLFQVDMIRPATAVLGPEVLREIGWAGEFLCRMGAVTESQALRGFREAFTARYGDREVPLVQALDEEIGVGFATFDGTGGEVAPMLPGLVLPETPAEVPSAPIGHLLLRKVVEAVAAGAEELELTAADLDSLFPQPAHPLPVALSVIASIAASHEAAERSEFRVCVLGATGPSGAQLLGRFCHADPNLEREVQRHLRTEEALVPDAIFAEVVHLPEGRTGNLLLRPILREYEIPYLGRSRTPPERQIPVSDLTVSVRDGQVVLMSRRLGRRVIPRLATAHNYGLRSLGIYRFLCSLQVEGTATVGYWDWGILATVPFLPRIVSGRVVFSPARWNLDATELRRLGAARDDERFTVIQSWRRERRLPRWVLLLDNDNRLPVDLDNVLSVETFHQLIRHRDQARLVEIYPPPDQLLATGPDGRYVHEIVVPLVRTSPTPTPRWPAGSRAKSTAGVQRSFLPGSEWMYAKLYTGMATADQLLREVIAPVTRWAQRAGIVDRWFFIRYGDPDWHLRLRWHGDSGRLIGELLPALQTTCSARLGDQFWRMQLDTYEREVERYGGADGIELAEALFHADSEAVLTLVEGYQGDAGGDARWQLTLYGIDLLFADLGFEAETRWNLARQWRDRYYAEFRINSQFRDQLSERFRRERSSLIALLDANREPTGLMAPGIAALHRRSSFLAPLITELHAHIAAGHIPLALNELAASYVHMHVNRLLRSDQRAQELVLYDFLTRLYGSQVARARVR